MPGPYRFLGIPLKVWAIVPGFWLAGMLFFTFAPTPVADKVADGILAVVGPPIHWLENRSGLPQLRFGGGPDIVAPTLQAIAFVALGPGIFVLVGLEYIVVVGILGQPGLQQLDPNAW